MTFDESTNNHALAHYRRCRKDYPKECQDQSAVKSDFTAGRNSAKESLSIALRALERAKGFFDLVANQTAVPREMNFPERDAVIEAIAQIKSRGDYIPMEGK